MMNYLQSGSRLTEEQQKSLDCKIQEMHQHNILHRDLHNLKNIVFHNNEPYIIDFGKAIKSTDKTALSKECSTLKQYIGTFNS